MNIIVIGGGKVGYYLAQTLVSHGHKTQIIEKDPAVCTKIANNLDLTVVCGDGTTIDILEHVDTQSADALISVTGRDEDNLIACQLAKRRFNVPRTVARVNNPKNVEVMKKLGVDIPISSTDNIARLLEREVDTATIKQIMSLNRGNTSLSELQIPQGYKLHGKSLSEMSMPDELMIVSIIRDGEMIIPRGNSQIFSGDKILIICQNSVLHDINKILSLEE